MVNNVVRNKHSFVENNKIGILFTNYVFGLTFQSPSSNFVLQTKNTFFTKHTRATSGKYSLGF